MMNSLCARLAATALMACSLASVTWADEVKAPGVPGNSAPPRQNTPNAITQTAFSKGVMKCASRVQQVTTFANAGPDVNASVTFFPPDTDNGLLSVIQAIETPQGPVSVSSTYGLRVDRTGLR